MIIYGNHILFHWYDKERKEGSGPRPAPSPRNATNISTTTPTPLSTHSILYTTYRPTTSVPKTNTALEKKSDELKEAPRALGRSFGVQYNKLATPKQNNPYASNDTQGSILRVISNGEPSTTDVGMKMETGDAGVEGSLEAEKVQLESDSANLYAKKIENSREFSSNEIFESQEGSSLKGTDPIIKIKKNPNGIPSENENENKERKISEIENKQENLSLHDQLANLRILQQEGKANNLTEKSFDANELLPELSEPGPQSPQNSATKTTAPSDNNLSSDAYNNQITHLQSLQHLQASQLANQRATENQLMNLKALQLDPSGESINKSTQSTAQKDNLLIKLRDHQLGKENVDVINNSVEFTTPQILTEQLQTLQRLQMRWSNALKRNSKTYVFTTTWRPIPDQLTQAQQQQAQLRSIQINQAQKYDEDVNRISTEEMESTESTTQHADNYETELKKVEKSHKALLKDVVESQVYRIENANDGLYLTVTGNNDAANKNSLHTVFTAEWKNLEKQKWIVKKQGKFYQLIPRTHAINVITMGKHHKRRQWNIKGANDDKRVFQFLSADGKKCIGSDGKLQTNDCRNSFLWSFISDQESQQ